MNTVSESAEKYYPPIQKAMYVKHRKPGKLIFFWSSFLNFIRYFSLLDIDEKFWLLDGTSIPSQCSY